MELERRVSTIEGLEFRETPDAIQFRGYAAVFGKWSEPLWGFREQIAAGAFKKTLSEKADVRMLVNHDGVPIARSTSGTLKLSEDSTGLLSEADLDRANPTVQELASAMRRKDLTQMSFGFRTIKDEWDESDPKDVRRTIREASLQNGDVSPVTYPAYPQTTAEIRSRFESRDVDTSSWDGSAAMGACNSAADFRQICAGEKSVGAPDERQHWALPHHYLGKGPNEDGVRNALSRLPQTKSLTNASAAKSHLQSHMKQIDPNYEADSLDLDDLEARLMEMIEESRQGKVLSAANANTLQMCVDMLEQMLADAGYPDTDDMPMSDQMGEGPEPAQGTPPMNGVMAGIQQSSRPLAVIHRARRLRLAQLSA